jgi:hypothetical protein
MPRTSLRSADLPAALLCFSLLIAVAPAIGQTLGDPCVPSGTPACNDVFTSLGSFKIQVSTPFLPLFAGYPGFSSGVLSSPVLFDPGTTVGRSVVIKDGSAADTVGTIVGSGGPPVTVNDSLLTPPPGFAGGGVGADEVHTQIFSFDLKNPAGNVQVRAGSAASDRPSSPGEVQSKSNSGLPANDFPAASFFDIFVDVDLPAFGSFNGGTVHNGDTSPLEILNNAVPNLPPKVIYIHGNSSAVPVFFNTTDPGGQYHAGDQLGWLILAGHGAGYAPTGQAGGQWTGPDVNQFQTFMSQQTPLLVAPEPGTMLIMACGLALLAAGRRRKS